MVFLRGAICKYSALGNDFLICERRRLPTAERVKKECENGGVDGFIVVKNLGTTPEMVIFNADGSRAETCGNGLRCVAAFCHEKGVNKRKFTIKTDAGEKLAEILNGRPFVCRVELGEAVFSDGKGIREEGLDPVEIEIDGRRVRLFVVDTGVPHAVIFGGDGLCRLAEQISKHESFERGTNVDFADTENGKIRIKTFERGVGWTKACGTGGGAVFAVCRRLGLVGEKSTVFFDGGRLTVETEENKIFITGEVKKEWER